MPTRQKKPSILKGLLLAVALAGMTGYLAYSAIGGQFGIESRKRMLAEIEVLKADSAALQVEIDSYRHRAALFSPTGLDPDILTERARQLLSMSHPEDIVVMVNPTDGSPISSSFPESSENKLIDIIQGNSGH